MSITVNELKNLLNYSPETGKFFWKERPIESFPVERLGKTWNTRFSGKEAGLIDAWGYVQIRIYTKHYKGHKLAWMYVYGENPTQDIDHVNGIKHDNRIENLRLATRSENNMNSKLNCRNKTGYRGVCFYKPYNNYRARICVESKEISLGYFDTAEEAYAAYCEAAKKYYGEFIRV